MPRSPTFAEQLEANLPKLDDRPEFDGDQLWLTFYLMGPPEHLQQVAGSLRARGWVNVEGWEGAFLYPKVRVRKSFEAILRTAEVTEELCVEHGIEILIIDADTSPDVEHSQLLTLYKN